MKLAVLTVGFMYKDKEGNTISPKRYAWGVIYKDGTELHQFQDNEYHQISEVDFGSVEKLLVYRFPDKEQVFTTLVTKEVKPFKFHYMTKPPWSPRFLRTDVFGLKWKGSKHVIYIHILPNDNVVVSPHDRVDIPRFI